uniref:Uncharacterized protein n=1 Tax=Opuntia streptacantha TaxID=393608 RepID=A0A7C9AXJ3_OPUST
MSSTSFNYDKIQINKDLDDSVLSWHSHEYDCHLLHLRNVSALIDVAIIHDQFKAPQLHPIKTQNVENKIRHLGLNTFLNRLTIPMKLRRHTHNTQGEKTQKERKITLKYTTIYEN